MRSSLNIAVCHTCPHSQHNQPGFKGGACACTIDPARRDITVRAAAGDCEFFTAEGRKAPAERALVRASPAKPCCGGGIVHGAIGLAKAGLGIDAAGRELEAKRHRICWGCDRRKGLLCGECGCLLMAKIKVKSEACPLSKW